MNKPKTKSIMPPNNASEDLIEIFIHNAHPADIASWLCHQPHFVVLKQLSKLNTSRQAKVFANLPLQFQNKLVWEIEQSDLVEIIKHMNADDRADLFNHLAPVEQTRFMQSLSQEDREAIICLSSYAEETAGSIMTTDYATIGAHMTAQEAIEALRSQSPGTETIYRSYITDDCGRLVGCVRLHELILAADGVLIEEIMESSPIFVTSDMDREDVAKTIARYDILAIPVVDADSTLLGIVTHDDATDALQAEITEDFQKISTVLPFTQSMRDASISVLYSKRIFWLALLVFGNLFSGAGIAYFEETILAYVSLVFFLPLLIDSSGNAGAQSATLMVRAIATGDVEMKDWRNLILRELGVATALGITMALVVFPLGIWRGGSDIAIVVGLTMFLVVIVGSLVGMSLPFLLSRLKLDPATASGPLVTTISDGVGVLVYFSIATLILNI